MYMQNNIGSKKLTKFENGTVTWVCTICNKTSLMRVNNWNSPKARTCCGGKFARNRDRLLIVWTDMNARCLDSKHPAYIRYYLFGKPAWNSKEEFSEWALSAGWEYGLDIDRIDNLKGYSKENCRFVTRKVNSRNKCNSRILEFSGEFKTAGEWAEDTRCSVQAQSILARIDRYGYSIEDAITKGSSHV